MTIENLKIDADLVEYLSKKKDVQRFINFCIRERRESLNADRRMRLSPSAVELKGHAIDPAFRNFLP